MNHAQAWDLIPWYVNGRAAEDERADIEQHLAQCGECRVEVEAQRRVMAEMKGAPLIESMPHASLQKLWARIDATPESSAQPRRSGAPRQTVRWLAAAAIVEAVLLGVLAVYALPTQQQSAAEFRTVSNASTAVGAPGVRAVFSPALTLGELQTLLERSKLTIVAGPSEAGVYTLAPVEPGGDLRAALTTLRAHPAARFAELVGP
jgi:anti-sigma factor RsiW